MTLQNESTFWRVAAMLALGLLLTYACACSRTQTYLPAPEQTGPWTVLEIAEEPKT